MDCEASSLIFQERSEELSSVAKQIIAATTCHDVDEAIGCLREQFERLKQKLFENTTDTEQISALSPSSLLESNLTSALMLVLSSTKCHQWNRVRGVDNLDKKIQFLQRRRRAFLEVFHSMESILPLLKPAIQLLDYHENLPLNIFSLTPLAPKCLKVDLGQTLLTDLLQLQSENSLDRDFNLRFGSLLVKHFVSDNVLQKVVFMIVRSIVTERQLQSSVCCHLDERISVFSNIFADNRKLNTEYEPNRDVKRTDFSVLERADKIERMIISILRWTRTPLCNLNPLMRVLQYPVRLIPKKNPSIAADSDSVSVASFFSFIKKSECDCHRIFLHPYIKPLFYTFSFLPGVDVNYFDMNETTGVNAVPNHSVPYPPTDCDSLNSEDPKWDDDILQGRLVGARFTLSLGLEIQPTSYCLTQIYNMDTYTNVRNWCLQASENGQEWFTLSVHKNDNRLIERGPQSTEIPLDPASYREWPQQNPERVQVPQTFRLFRIMDLSPYEKQGRLGICGFDLYGTITTIDHVFALPSESPNQPVKRLTNANPPAPADDYSNCRMRALRDGECFKDIDYSHRRLFGNAIEICLNPLSTKISCQVARELNKNGWSKMSWLSLGFSLGSVSDLKMTINNPSASIFAHILKVAQTICQMLPNTYQCDHISDKVLFRKVEWLAQHLVSKAQSTFKISWKPQPTFSRLLTEEDLRLCHTRQNIHGRENNVGFGKSDFMLTDAEGILQLLHLLFKLYGCNEFGGGGGGGNLKSRGLCAKLEIQLLEPLAVLSGGVLPNWCVNLPQHLKPLFPFLIRQRLLRSNILSSKESRNQCATNRQTFMAARSEQSDPPVPALVMADLFRSLLRYFLPSIHSTSVTYEVMLMQRDETEADNGRLFWAWAERLLDEAADHDERVNVEYYDEEGTGDGVTRDFYSQLGRELMRRHETAAMWMQGDPMGSNSQDGAGSGAFINPAFGLFPTPYPQHKVPLKVLRRFYVMGIAVGRIIRDDRTMYLPLSTPFLKLLVGFGCSQKWTSDPGPKGDGEFDEEMFDVTRTEFIREQISLSDDPRYLCPRLERSKQSELRSRTHWITGLLDLDDFALLYPSHASLISDLMKLHRRHENIREEHAREAHSDVSLDDLLDEATQSLLQCPISDLYLDMQIAIPSSRPYAEVTLMDTYPWETQCARLAESEEQKPDAVTNSNYMAYARRILEFCLDKGIRLQMDAFKLGFERVMSMEWLALFTSAELGRMISGDSTDVNWSKEDLLKGLKPSWDLRQSETFLQLVEVLAELNAEERRLFLLFTTGCYHLPVGGLRALTPRLRVQVDSNPISLYPRSQACYNLLFIARSYTSSAQLREYLLTSIRQRGFHIR